MNCLAVAILHISYVGLLCNIYQTKTISQRQLIFNLFNLCLMKISIPFTLLCLQPVKSEMPCGNNKFYKLQFILLKYTLYIFLNKIIKKRRSPFIQRLLAKINAEETPKKHRKY
jgi:predicted membrane protein